MTDLLSAIREEEAEERRMHARVPEPPVVVRVDPPQPWPAPPTTEAEKAEKKSEFVADGGATSSHREPDWSLLITEGLEAFVRRRALGARLHGRDNWKQGNRAFVDERKLHLFHHALGLVTGDATDDHLGGIICNAFFLAYFEKHPPKE